MKINDQYHLCFENDVELHAFDHCPFPTSNWFRAINFCIKENLWNKIISGNQSPLNASL